MKTTLDVMTILYQLLKNSSLASEITGKISKGLRSANSKKEDIVINSLPMNSEQLQRCVANVNIYVPSIMSEENGIVTEKPDFIRLDELVDIALTTLKDVKSKRDYSLSWQQVSSPIWDQDSNSFFVNIRIDFYANNI